MNPFALNDAIRFVQASNVARVEAARRLIEESRIQNPESKIRIGTAISATVEIGALPCGGDYPPCYVALRESHNEYGAYNPNGCGGNACFGRWQFSGAWAGKLGLPLDLRTATPAQQDEAARLLWNHGAGCSNWAAC